MANKNDLYYIKQALIEIDHIVSYTRGLSYENFMKDVKTVDATMFRLQQMVEKIKCLSQDFKSKHDEIPWGEIVGFRNGIVHDYGKTDYTTVFEVVSFDIYRLKELFEREL